MPGYKDIAEAIRKDNPKIASITDDKELVNAAFQDNPELAKAFGEVEEVAIPTREGQPTDSFVGNIAESIYQNLYNMPKEAITHPIKTATSIYEMASGAKESILSTGDLIKSVLPEGIEKNPQVAVALNAIKEQTGEDKEKFKAVIDFFKQRYGGYEQVKQTAYKDPIGVLTDLASLLTGVGGGVKGAIGSATKAGMLSKIGTGAKVADIAGGVAKAGELINPISAATRLATTTGSGILGGIKKGLAPAEGSYDVARAGLFKKYGIEPTAGMVSTSERVKAAEGIAAKGWFGKEMTDKITKVGDDVNKAVDTIIAKIPANAEPLSVGKTVVNAFENARAKFFTTKAELYKNANLYKLKNEIQVPETVKFLNEQLRIAKMSKMPPPELSTIQQLVDGLKSKTLTVKDVAATLKTVNERLQDYEGVAIESGKRAVLSKVAATLDKELDKTLGKVRPDMKEAIDKANLYFATTKDKLNTLFGGSVKTALENGQYDKVTKALMNSNISIMDIPKVYELLGKEAKTALQAYVVEDLFKTAKGTKEAFTGLDLERKIQKYSPQKLKEILIDKPEIFDAIIDVKEMGKLVSGGKWALGGSETAHWIRRMNQIKAGTIVGAYLDPKALALFAVEMLGDYGFSKLISSPVGQKWMSEGYQITPGLIEMDKVIQKAAPTVAKVATVAAQAKKYLEPDKEQMLKDAINKTKENK